ncbi:MAG: DMT family transporter [Candidatus Pacebacteria bacterium]|nr:DMT family transporter [Candidatus Paceibacterota bacterium]
MLTAFGIGLSFVAMLSWGFGDFMIQKSTKRLGDWETLFFITLFGTVILAPFVWRKIPELFTGSHSHLIILICAAFALLIAAILDFEGFKRGKISVLEPIMSFEILAASFLSFFFLGDKVSFLQIGLIIVLIAGLCLVSFRGKFMAKSFLLEKGVIVFLLGSILMGATDFFLGWGSRVTDPFVANFVINVIMMTVAGLFLIFRPKSRTSVRNLKENRALLLVMSIADNTGWIAYAVAMTLVPIAVATGLSESSIIIAVLLGLFVNKERLQRHQKYGLGIALVSVMVLAFVTAG